jgi:hypothetical protein
MILTREQLRPVTKKCKDCIYINFKPWRLCKNHKQILAYIRELDKLRRQLAVCPNKTINKCVNSLVALRNKRTEVK